MDPRDQEDFVVHREPEEDGEHHHGQERFDGTGSSDVEEGAEDAVLEHRRQDAESGGDGEQVHHRSRQRHHQRPEHDGKQDEGQQHHQADEERQLLTQDVGEVDEDRCDPTDQHHRAGPLGRRWQGARSEMVDQIRGANGLRRRGGIHERDGDRAPILGRDRRRCNHLRHSGLRLDLGHSLIDGGELLLGVRDRNELQRPVEAGPEACRQHVVGLSCRR